MGHASSNLTLQDKQLFLNQSSVHSSSGVSQSTSNHLQRPLSHFRGKLLPEECIYVFATLMQQYFLIIRKKICVVISDELCSVNQNGILQVMSWKQNSPSFDLTDNYVKAISEIIEVVTNLCQNRQSLWQGQNGKLKQKLVTLVYQYHQNDQILNQKLQNTVFKFISNKIATKNLLSALQRINLDERKQSVKHHRYHSANIYNPSFANIDINSSISLEQFKETKIPSKRFNKKRNDNRKPTFSCQFQSSEKEDTQYMSPDFSYCYSNSIKKSEKQNKTSTENTCFKKKKKSSAKFYVSPQYSLSIAFHKPEKQQDSPGISKISCIRNNQYRTQTSKSSCSPDVSQRKLCKLQRMNTEGHFQNPNKKKSFDFQRENEKSVLATMARLVEVREEPSSRQFII